MTEYILCHHGVKGQEWGKRRYQYDDGSLTPEGREHYGVSKKVFSNRDAKKYLGKNGKLNNEGQAKYEKMYQEAKTNLREERAKQGNELHPFSEAKRNAFAAKVGFFLNKSNPLGGASAARRISYVNNARMQKASELKQAKYKAQMEKAKQVLKTFSNTPVR